MVSWEVKSPEVDVCILSLWEGDLLRDGRTIPRRRLGWGLKTNHVSCDGQGRKRVPVDLCYEGADPDREP